MQKIRANHNLEILKIKNQIDDIVKELALNPNQGNIDITDQSLKKIERLKKKIVAIKNQNIRNNYAI